MGIINIALLLGDRLRDVLITPHGDYQPRPMPSPSAQSRISLPLMGIINDENAIVAPPHRPFLLITPHGDYQRGRRPQPSPASRAAHYPSWGLSTLDRRRSAVVRRALITPHGDYQRRPQSRAASRSTSSLITPHGDYQRLEGPQRAQVIHLTHYPSWGLSTAHGGLAEHRRQRAHYPSWGLSTSRARTRCPGRCTGSHYPSWGLSTLADSTCSPVVKSANAREHALRGRKCAQPREL